MSYLIFFYLLKTKDNQSRYGVDEFKKMLVCIGELYWRRIESEERGQ